MELGELFSKVNDLTGKYPHLSKDEIKELMTLSRNLSLECGNTLYDMSLEEQFNKE